MERTMDEPTPLELKKALGAFMIAFGASMPKEIAARIANNLTGLGLDIERDGEPRVGMLCKDFAEALVSPHTSD